MENSWQIQKRKEMKRGYSKILYNQRNKDETIVSVIKRLFGEHISSRLIRMQNRELILRCITYNLHRMLNLITIKWILLSRSTIVFFFPITYLIYNFYCKSFTFNNNKKMSIYVIDLWM